MNPPLTFSQALTQLKLLTSQTANFTFTDNEITQALQTAWQDSFAGNIAFDSSLTYSLTQFQYTLPTTITTVRELYIQKASDKNPEKISQDLYEVINGVITFNAFAQNFLSDTFTIYIKGFYKLQLTDSLTTDVQVNYVLYLAADLLLNQLILKRAFVFLRNDTTSRDIAEAEAMISKKVLQYKQKILREFEAV